MKISQCSLYVTVFCCMSCNTGETDSGNTGNDSLLGNVDSLESVANIADSNAAVIKTGDFDYSFAYQALYNAKSEISMAEMAADRTQNERIKKFAVTVITDYRKIETNLEKSYDFKTASYPAITDNDMVNEMNRIKALQGNAFDEAYLQLVFINHKRNFRIYEDASQKCKSDSLKKFASAALPVLQKHLNSVNALIQ